MDLISSGDADREAATSSVCESPRNAGDERDHAGDERDHAGDERDHAGDERDHAGDERDHAGDERDHAGDERDQVAEQRDRAAEQRDRAGGERDDAADHRDHAGDARDQLSKQRDHAAELSEAEVHAGRTTEVPGQSALARREFAVERRRASEDRRAGARERTQAEFDRDMARADRQAGATERTKAEADRDTSLADRGAGAYERTQAEGDRSSAFADRGASATERHVASVDSLTGVYLRGTGFLELDREIARANRTKQTLVLAFVDVDHLKAINDVHGHAAGDRMLVEVAKSLRSILRSYDLIFRYGGDEFVCAIPALNVADAAQRLALVNTALAQAPVPGSVTAGLAELRADDTTADLVERADMALYRARGNPLSAGRSPR